MSGYTKGTIGYERNLAKHRKRYAEDEEYRNQRKEYCKAWRENHKSREDKDRHNESSRRSYRRKHVPIDKSNWTEAHLKQVEHAKAYYWRKKAEKQKQLQEAV